MSPIPRYAQDHAGHMGALRAAAREHFASRGISRHANAEMHLKSALILAGMLGSYSVAVFSAAPVPARLLAWAALGFFLLHVAIGIAHDASHNAYAASRRANKALTLLFDAVGINTHVWGFTHMVSHHRAPNIGGHDAAIQSSAILRLHDQIPPGPLHRFQHLYFPLVYGVVTAHKWLVLDVASLLRRRVDGADIPAASAHQWAWLIASKVLVGVVFLGVPLMFGAGSAAVTLIGFGLMHFVAGTAIGVIFQVTHVADRTEQIAFPEGGQLDRSFVQHTLATTSDFARRSRLASWLCGGLNVHVTHHLFPDVCQVHLRELSDVVARVVRERGLEYIEYPTASAALASHARRLRQLGSAERPSKIANALQGAA